MFTEQNKILVRRFLTEVWVQGNLDNLEEMIAASHVHHLTRRKLYGPQEVRELVDQFRTFCLLFLKMLLKKMCPSGRK